MSLNQNLCNACRDNDINLVNELIKQGANDFNRGLRWASFKGNVEIVKLMIENGATDGLWNACYGGNIEIIELLIGKGANDFNQGLIGACRAGHIEIVKLMIENRAPEVLDLNGGLQETCSFSNNKELMLLLIIKGADINVSFPDLNFEDIYYLLHAGITNFGKFSNIALECKKFKQEFLNIAQEFFIKDVANIVSSY